MQRRKRFVITTEDDYSIATGYLDENETLKALGFSLDEEEYIDTDTDSIKYELLGFIRGKASDLIIFNRYINNGSYIDAATIFRIKMGAASMDFIIYNSKINRNLRNIIMRAERRLSKIEAANRYRSLDALNELFNNLKGNTITEILAKAQASASHFPKEANNGENNQNKNFIGQQNTRIIK